MLEALLQRKDLPLARAGTAPDGHMPATEKTLASSPTHFAGQRIGLTLELLLGSKVMSPGSEWPSAHLRSYGASVPQACPCCFHTLMLTVIILSH